MRFFLVVFFIFSLLASVEANKTRADAGKAFKPKEGLMRHMLFVKQGEQGGRRHVQTKQ